MSEARVIKRYSNRKLFDNKTQEDITKATLAQILYEQEKANQSSLPLSTLKGIIRSSGEQIHKRLTSTAHALRGEAERKMTSLKEQAERRMDKIGEEAKTVVEVTQTAIDELTKAVDDRFKQLIGFPRISTPEEEPEPSIVEILENIQARLDSLDKRLKALEKERK
jgi:polyhydroxyalkanoate synthesis regulator protein